MRRLAALFALLLCLLGPGHTGTAADGSLRVYFLDVGQGDAALLLCDGEAMLIDGGPRSASQLIYTVLREQNITRLRYLVASHAHEDHVGGLSAALHAAQADTVLCSVTQYDNDSFRDFLETLEEQGLSLTVPSPGDRFRLGGAEIEVLAPLRPAEEHNNDSLVLRVSYGKTSFLFTADAEREEETDLLLSGAALESDVIKLGHHGSDTSTAADFLAAVSPKYAVISAGADNPYGCPADGTLRCLGKAGVTVYRTDLQGTVLCESDGETLHFTVERNAGADTLAQKEAEPLPTPTDGGELRHVINRNSGKFHLPHCSGLKNAKRSNLEGSSKSREELLSEGYLPCGTCDP